MAKSGGGHPPVPFLMGSGGGRGEASPGVIARSGGRLSYSQISRVRPSGHAIVVLCSQSVEGPSGFRGNRFYRVAGMVYGVEGHRQGVVPESDVGRFRV